MKKIITLTTFISFMPFAQTNHVIGSGFMGGGVVSGSILLSSGECPAGYTEYTAARGLYLVGVPSGGTIAGTVGSAMTDQQNITHTHSVSTTTGSNLSQIGTGVYVMSTLSNTGTASTGNFAPYIQMRLCEKD